MNRAVDLLTNTSICANLYAVGCTFAVDDMKSLLPGVIGQGRTEDIYERCYRVIFFNILQLSPFKGIDLVFDRKKKAVGRVQAHFERAKSMLDRDPRTAGTLNDCRFEDDRHTVPLQAADLLAFELRRRAWDRLRDGSVPVRPAYERLRSVFRLTRDEARPPYRQRMFRCYDARFIQSLRQVVSDPEHHPITEEDILYLWHHMDAPED